MNDDALLKEVTPDNIEAAKIKDACADQGKKGKKVAQVTIFYMLHTHDDI